MYAFECRIKLTNCYITKLSNIYVLLYHIHWNDGSHITKWYVYAVFDRLIVCKQPINIAMKKHTGAANTSVVPNLMSS